MRKFTYKYSIDGADEVSGLSPDSLDRSNQFVDLHLDFPTYRGEYVAGNTPFIRAHTKLKDNLLIYEAVLEMLQAAVKDKQEIEAIIRFYLTGNHILFEKSVRHYLKKTDFPCDKQVDRNRALYQLLEIAFMGLTDPPSNAEFVESVYARLRDLHKAREDAFGSLIEELMGSGFLKDLQKDCLEIYERILEANEVLRPALYYSFVEDDNKETSLRIADSNFSRYKGVFVDISESLSRQLVLIAGINNIDKRGVHDSFDPTIKKSPKDLHEYADRPLGTKANYILKLTDFLG